MSRGRNHRYGIDFERHWAGEIYIAVSDGLTQWAQSNHRLHLFKLGSTGFAHEREASLNGDPRFGWTIKPCLGFRDWRIIGSWPLYDNENRRSFEGYIRRRFARILGHFDFREVHGATHAGNGETEIYRLPLDLLPMLPGLFEKHKLKGMIGGIATEMIDLLVADIRRRSDPQHIAGEASG